MRCFISILFALGFSYATTAANVTAVVNGEWLAPTTWNCNCIPAANVNVNIPEGIRVTISRSVVFVASPKVTITIRGVLEIVGTSLFLDGDDEVTIADGGAVSNTSARGAVIYFGKMPVFVATENDIDDDCTISSGKLPARLIGFKTRPEGKEVCIQWSSVHGFDYDVYTLERSSDGIHFIVINQQRGINSTPENFVNCVYYDQQPLEGIVYYRLKASRKNQEDAFIVIALTPKQTKRTTF